MVQILPVDDAFDAGAPAHGSFSTLYLGCVASTSAVGFWVPSGAAFVVRPMHGSYQTVSSSGVQDNNAAFYSNGSSAARSPSGMVFRRPFGTDVTVTGTFEMRSLAGGAPRIGQIGPWGVFARISGGTLAGDGTADVRVANVDGYMASIYVKDSDGTYRLGITRINAGVFTSGVVESAALFTGFFDFSKTATIALTVSGTGATVTLSATVFGFGSTVPFTISGTDISGSRITAVGRCGFHMASDRILGPRTMVDLCHMFAVDEGGTRLVQDEFRRLSLAGSKQTPTDAAGTVGSGYTSSGFFWDAATFDGTDTVGSRTFTGSKRLTTLAATVVFDNQITDDQGPTTRQAPGRMLLSQRPSDNRFSQHRTITCRIPSAPAAATGEVWAGLVLHANQAKPRDQASGPVLQSVNSNPNVPNGSGYAFVCRAQSATQVTWQLHRMRATGFQGTQDHLAIARLVDTSAFTHFPGYAVTFDMELDVRPRLEAQPDGVVELVCKVDGTVVDMALVGSPTGITKSAAGIYHDGSSERITENVGEGLFTCNGLVSTTSGVNDIDPLFDTWVQGTLTNAILLDRDQASISVAPEAIPTGTALDTIIGPDWPFEIEHRSYNLDIPFESGHRQTAPRFLAFGTDALTCRALYHFTKQGVLLTELELLIAHWDDNDGSESAFSFTAPGDNAVTVHYVEGSLDYSSTDKGAYEVRFSLEELK